MNTWSIIHGDCLDLLPQIQTGTIDAVITDPPYPCIKRTYGVWTEDEWWELMMGVCREVRRILKPNGSAVFILQPNSRKIGSMRGWLFRFQAWVCENWNMVQDVWWWNRTAMAVAHSTKGGLLRPSMKACIWCGPADCYRDQASVMKDAAVYPQQKRSAIREHNPSGHSVNRSKMNAAAATGKASPFNVLPFCNGSYHRQSSKHKHPACTPIDLVEWWVRYISPPSGTVLDPFVGLGTTLLASMKEGRSSIGIESMAEYVAVARQRLSAVEGS